MIKCNVNVLYSTNPGQLPLLFSIPFLEEIPGAHRRYLSLASSLLNLSLSPYSQTSSPSTLISWHGDQKQSQIAVTPLSLHYCFLLISQLTPPSSFAPSNTSLCQATLASRMLKCRFLSFLSHQNSVCLSAQSQYLPYT